MKKVYWSNMTVGKWSMYSAATEKGICYIGTPNAPFEELERWVKKQIQHAELIECAANFKECEEALRQYDRGERRSFTIPLDLYGTDFQRKVWKALQRIPYGETFSYIKIAEEIQNPRAVRAVGGAIGANPVPIIVPCHRVITKDGKLGGFRAGVTMKETLLELERSKAVLVDKD